MLHEDIENWLQTSISDTKCDGNISNSLKQKIQSEAGRDPTTSINLLLFEKHIKETAVVIKIRFKDKMFHAANIVVSA